MAAAQPSSSLQNVPSLTFNLNNRQEGILKSSAPNLCFNQIPNHGQPDVLTTLTNCTPTISYVDALKGKDVSQEPVPAEINSSDFVFAELKSPTTIKGSPAILFDVSEQASMVSKFQYTLIGKFSHGKPTWKKLIEFFNQLKLKSDCKVSIFDKKHLYIVCSNRTDFNRLWLRLVWNVDGFLMRIFKWEPHFNALKESSIAPVWVRFEGLPLYMFDKMPLLNLSNAIGKPICIDNRNLNGTMLNSALVCVELDVAKPLIDHIKVGIVHPESKAMVEELMVQVFYDMVPSFCCYCWHIGHSHDLCKRTSNQRLGKELADMVLVAPEKERGRSLSRRPQNRTRVTWVPKAATEEYVKEAAKQTHSLHSVKMANSFAALEDESHLLQIPQTDVATSATVSDELETPLHRKEIDGKDRGSNAQILIETEASMHNLQLNWTQNIGQQTLGDIKTTDSDTYSEDKKQIDTQKRSNKIQISNHELTALGTIDKGSANVYKSKNTTEQNSKEASLQSAIVHWDVADSAEQNNDNVSIKNAAEYQTNVLVAHTDLEATIEESNKQICEADRAKQSWSNERTTLVELDKTEATTNSDIGKSVEQTNVNMLSKVVTDSSFKGVPKYDNKEENGSIKLISEQHLKVLNEAASHHKESIMRVFKNTLTFYISDLNTQTMKQQKFAAETLLATFYKKHINSAIEEEIKKDIATEASAQTSEQDWQIVSCKKKRGAKDNNILMENPSNGNSKNKQNVEEERVVNIVPRAYNTKHNQDVDTRMASLCARINKMRRDSPAKRKLQAELKVLRGH